jgi:phosphatidylglycerophosphate synthase
LFAILLGLFIPDSFGENINSISDYLFRFVISTPFYLMYSFPVILIYGVLTSIISDKIGLMISSKIENEKSEIFLSGILHVVFGLILFPLSLGASMLFFITDRFLQKKYKEYKLVQALKSLALPLAVWLFFMGIVYLIDYS